MFQSTQNGQVATCQSTQNDQVATCQSTQTSPVAMFHFIRSIQVVTFHSIQNGQVVMPQSVQNSQVAMSPSILSSHQKLGQMLLKSELRPSFRKELYCQSPLMQKPCLIIQRVKPCRRILRLDNIQRVQTPQLHIGGGRERPDQHIPHMKQGQARRQKPVTGILSNAFVHLGLRGQDVKNVSAEGCTF